MKIELKFEIRIKNQLIDSNKEKRKSRPWKLDPMRGPKGIIQPNVNEIGNFQRYSVEILNTMKIELKFEIRIN